MTTYGWRIKSTLRRHSSLIRGQRALRVNRSAEWRAMAQQQSFRQRSWCPHRRPAMLRPTRRLRRHRLWMSVSTGRRRCGGAPQRTRDTLAHSRMRLRLSFCAMRDYGTSWARSACFRLRYATQSLTSSRRRCKTGGPSTCRGPIHRHRLDDEI